MEVFFFFLLKLLHYFREIASSAGCYSTKMGTTSSKRVGVTAPLVFDAFHVM